MILTGSVIFDRFRHLSPHEWAGVGFAIVVAHGTGILFGVLAGHVHFEDIVEP